MPLTGSGIEHAYEPGRPVLRGVNLDIPEGLVTALVGPNGAGKSTLLKILAGVLPPESGRVLLDGSDLPRLPAGQRASRIGYVPQRSSIAFPFSVRQVVRMGRYALADDPAAIASAIDRVGLTARADEPFGILSAGQQQRATLARVLAQLDRGAGPFTTAAYLLADEPVSAMDPRHALETMTLLRALAAAGAGVLVVLHDLTLAARFADRAVVLSAEGSVIAAGEARGSGGALEPPVLERVFGVSFVRVDAPAGGAIIPIMPAGAAHP